MKVIACIENPVVIQKILDHLKDKAETTEHTPLPESRPACSADVSLVQPIVLSPAGYGKGAVGLMAGMGRKAALARADFS
jgi:hypothetical protein